jgi:uncharacterized protein (DUF885 family)
MNAFRRVSKCSTLLVATFVLLAQSVQAADIETFFSDYAADWVRSNPDLATSSRYFSGDEQNQLERQITPQTRAWQLERIKRAENGLSELKKFDRSTLTQVQRVSADLMQWQLEAVVRQGKYLDYDFPLDQFQGVNVYLVEALTLRHPLTTVRDAENYLARLELIAPRMNEALDDAEQLVQKKRMPPRFILQATLASMRTFIGVPAEQNPLVTAYAQKLDAIKEIDAAKRVQLKVTATRLVGRDVYPAWQNAIALLEAALPASNDDAGLWRYKEGAAVYANALRRFTTTNYSADQIHKIGLEQVARIENQMDVILKRIGRTQGTVRERMNKLEIDLRYPDPTSDASRAQIMKDIDVLIRDAIVRSEPMFARMPKAPVIAQPFPKFREAAAAANYNRAPLDGSRPAIYQMPLRVSRMTKLGLRTLVYHETVPGHHFQIGLEQENTALPRFRQARALGGISALSEGWGLYAERLAVESGWYRDDPEGELGQLNAELFRARRLVVDTGIHAKRWTRQQAIDYGIEASEIERYVVNPGQACSYMIGQLKIIDMRDRAKQQLGNKFSLKEFHSVVLDTGTAPLELLQREVDAYVRAKKKS